MTTTADIDYIKACLSYIDPSLPRNDWVNIGMALQYELGDNLGYQVFQEWSSQSPNFNSRQFESTWKSFKQGFSSFKLGTIIYYAKSNGFDPKSIKPNTERGSPDFERLQAERRKAEKIHREQAQQKAAAAREIALKRWNQSPPPNPVKIHPYLLKKGCPHPVGPVKQYKGFLQIPAFNKDGVLTTLMSINETGFKNIIKNSTISGSSMTIGKRSDNIHKSILLCEGWATGQSLYAASKLVEPECGLQVVVAFNSNNLVHVAENIRDKYPDRTIIICADNDCCNRENAGLLKAEATKEALGQLAEIIYPVFPEAVIQEKLLKEESIPSDFNDLHLMYGETGLHQIADNISAAIIKVDQEQTHEQLSTHSDLEMT